MTRRRRLPLALAGALLLVVTACGEDTPETATGDISDQPASRVVVLGEEPLLADVLSLGVTPVAATAAVGRRFQGIEEGTRGVTALPADVGIDDVRDQEPDLIIASGEAAEDIGLDRLEEVASTAVIDGADWRAAFTDLARELGAADRAAGVLGEYDAAVAAARSRLGTGLSASLATVVAEDELRVWVDGPRPVPATFLDAGVVLSPGAGTYPEAEGGGATIGLDRVGDLGGSVVVLVQSPGADAEEAVQAVQATPQWKALPAVAARRVVTIDRLDYPGVTGRARLAAELPELLAPSPS